MAAFRTGDMMLYPGGSDDAWYDKLIEGATHSPYEHIGVVVVDPEFDPGCETDPDGVYVMQSEGEWPPPAKKPCGVICKSLQYERNTRQRLHVRRYVGEPQLDAVKVWEATRSTTYDYSACDWFRVGLDHICGRCTCCAAAGWTPASWSATSGTT